MKKPRLDAIEYIRGISMMGVVGIHIGSQYLMNPTPNLHLVALFEIFTRFSVPIFFFISAFGLFYNMDTSKPFTMADYKSFLIRRGKTVVIPYIVWSLFYTFHNAWLFGYLSSINIPGTISNLFFGNCSYQLYFMVLLIWFYLFMPLWIKIVNWCNGKKLVFLMFLQIGINYALDELVNPYYMEPSYLKTFLTYRLNYWVIYYFFIFVLGGWLAVHSDTFHSLMKNHRGKITIFFWGAMATLLGYYYKLEYVNGYTPLEGVFTAHQLCPPGVVYTVAASLFFFTIFTYRKFPDFFCPILSLLGRHSYFAYLAHPLAITYLTMLMANHNMVISAPVAIILYWVVLALTLLAAVIMRCIGEAIPVINELTIGIYKKN